MRPIQSDFVTVVQEDWGSPQGAVDLADRELNANDFKRVVLQLAREKERKPPRKCRKNSTLTCFVCHSCGMNLFTLAEMLHALVGRGTILKELDYGVLKESDLPCTLKLVKQIFIGFLSSRPALEKIKIQFGSGGISDEDVGFLTEALRENTTVRHIEGIRDELNADEACTVDSLSDNVCFEAKYLLTMNEHRCRTVSPLKEIKDFVEKVAEASNEINVIYHFVRNHAELVVSSR
eukprot:scaffold4260_cov153-Amphora_coffeaeformis.AAC.1